MGTEAEAFERALGGKASLEQELGHQEQLARPFVLEGTGLGMGAPGPPLEHTICTPCPLPQSRSRDSFDPSPIVWSWARPSPGLWTPSNSYQLPISGVKGEPS